MKDSCVYIPEINNEPSKLYLELTENVKEEDRTFVNYIYARYVASNTAKLMDDAGYIRNSQNQHSAKDIYEFLNISEMIKEAKRSDAFEAINLGVANAVNEPIDFTNVEEAYEKALQYNSTHTGKLAYVVQHGDTYNVFITNTNSKTQYKKHLVEAQMLSWDFFKSQVIASGIDLNLLLNSAGETLNPLNLMDFLDVINLLQTSSINVFSVPNIKTFLALGSHLPQVQAILNRGWGTLEEIAEKCYDALKNPNGVTSNQLNLIKNALNAAKNPSVFNAKEVRTRIKDEVLKDFEIKSESQKIQDTINDLELKYGIGSNNIIKTHTKIKTLEEAVIDAIITLEREIRVLENKGSFEASKELQKTKEILEQELENKKSYFGLVLFLNQALKYSLKIEDMLKNIPIGSNTFEQLRNSSDVVSRAVSLLQGYYDIVSSLSDIDHLVIEENIRSQEKEQLQNQAKEVKKILDGQKSLIEEFQQQLLFESMDAYLGTSENEISPKIDIATIIDQEVSVTDYLYSMGKNSNDIIATMGTIIREKQIERDEKVNKLRIRIRKSTKKLYDKGYTSDCVYDEHNRLISEEGIDWEKYERAKKKEFATLVNLGFKGVTLKEALDTWEFNNTIEKVVDKKTGRIERIPNGAYRLTTNPYDALSQTEKTYYKEMMEIKGELESLLPPSAQHHFFAPQIRKEWLDVISEGIKGKLTAYEVFKMTWDRIKNFKKIREDDVEYINGVRYTDYNSTPLRDIPVFYQTPLDNPKELLHDFSAAIQKLATTAYNYEAMSSIQSTVELIQDLVNNMSVAAKDNNGKDIIDKIPIKERGNWLRQINKYIVVKGLGRLAEGSSTKEMLNSYIEMHLYNVTRKGNKKINKWVDLLLGYNSVTKLALNVTGATSNIIQGDLQMIIEAGGGRYYHIGHLLQAHVHLFGDLVSKTHGKIYDLLTYSKNNLDVLISDFFDPKSSNYSDITQERYYTNPFRRLFGELDATGLYSAGEYLIRTINMYAVLYKEKVLLNGEEVSLINALKKSEPENGISVLELKDGVTTLDHKPLTLNDEYFKRVKLRIKASADDCFGSMNAEDKGIINQHFLGRAAMNFKSWMIGHYSRRFRTRHWDYSQQRYIEGYWTTVWRLVTGYKKFREDYAKLSFDLKEDVKANCWKAVTEFAIFMALQVINFFWGDEDDDETWAERWGTLLLKRTLNDVKASMPTALFSEFYKLSTNLLPVLRSVTGIAYVFTGLATDLIEINDYGEIQLRRIKSGRYAGDVLYLRNLKWYTLPFYKQIDQLMHLMEEDSLYTVYERPLR